MMTSLIAEFIKKQLMPKLMPFDGYNLRSIVIMDNCSVHHTEEVSRLTQ